MQQKFDYKKAMAELEQIAAKVENPETGIDDIAALVKRSTCLIKECRDYLRTAREAIESEQSNA